MHYSFHILFIKSKSHGPVYTQREEIKQRHEYRERGSLGVISEASYGSYREKGCRLTLSVAMETDTAVLESNGIKISASASHSEVPLVC